MTSRRVSDQMIVWLLAAGVLTTAVGQMVWWRSPLPALRLEGPGARSLTREAMAQAPVPDTRYTWVGPARAPVAAAAISPAHTLVAILDDSGEVTVWDVMLGTLVTRFATGLEPSKRTAPIPIAIRQPAVGGLPPALVAIGGPDGILRVWNVPDGTPILTVPHSARDAARPEDRNAPLVDVEITAKGGPVSVSSNGSLAFWATRQLGGDSSLIGITRGPGGKVRDVSIQSSLRWMAAASDEAAYVSAMRTGSQTWTPIAVSTGGSDPASQAQAGARPRGPVQSVQYSRRGDIIAVVWSDGEIHVGGKRLFDALPSTGAGPRRRLVAFADDWDVNVSFREDGVIAATDGDRSITVKWLKRPPNPGATLTAPGGPIQSLWFTSDNRHVVVSARGDRYLHFLQVPGGPRPY